MVIDYKLQNLIDGIINNNDADLNMTIYIGIQIRDRYYIFTWIKMI